MQLIAQIVVLASLYALLAAGFVVVYRSSKVLNLAYGEFMMIGGYLVVMAGLYIAPGNPLVVIAISFVGAIIIALLIYYVIMRRLIGQPIVIPILVTIGLSILLQGIITAIFGSQLQYLDRILGISNPPHNLPFGVVLSTFDILTITVAGAFLLALFIFYRFTNLGIQMRAAAENPSLAAKRRINIFRLFAISWVIAMIGAVASGILWGGSKPLYPEMGIKIALQAFPAAMVGGMDSLFGVIPGSLIIASSVILCMIFISPLASQAVPMIILLLVLLIRPWGIFGRAEEIERV